jgi:hypothetical protein
MPGTIDSGAMPLRPGTTGSSCCSGATRQSQVLVPRILTRVPGATPLPTAPRCASSAPTATGMPAGRRSCSATAAHSVPARRSPGKAGARNELRTRASSGESAWSHSASGRPFQRGWYIALCAAAQIDRGAWAGSRTPHSHAGTKSQASIHAAAAAATRGWRRAQRSHLLQNHSEL